MKTGVFGGSFDPPHFGHICIIAIALSEGMDNVIVVPAGNHPFGKKLTDFDIRYRMCTAAFSVFGEKITISDIENQPGHSGKTWDTMCYLQDLFTENELTLFIGEDNSARWNEWYRGNELKERWKIRTIGRGQNSNVPFSLPNFNSTKIRHRIATGSKELLPISASVLNIINEFKLYRTFTPPNVAIIGMGKVGSSIYKTLISRGIKVTHTVDLELHDNDVSCRSLNEIDFKFVDLIFLCTPDDVLIDLENKVNCPILSVSGNQRIRAVNCDQEKIILFHPAAAITERFSDLSNVMWTLSARKLSDIDRNLINSLDFQYVEMPYLADLNLYHAACNLASNAVSSIQKASMEILTNFCGISEDQSFKLIKSLSFAQDTDLKYLNSLSGPVFRKQWEVITKHINALHEHSNLLSGFYISVISGICDLYDINPPEFLKNRFQKNHQKP